MKRNILLTIARRTADHHPALEHTNGVEVFVYVIATDDDTSFKV